MFDIIQQIARNSLINEEDVANARASLIALGYY